jgi:hypothetical protein
MKILIAYKGFCKSDRVVKGVEEKFDFIDVLENHVKYVHDEFRKKGEVYFAMSTNYCDTYTILKAILEPVYDSTKGTNQLDRMIDITKNVPEYITHVVILRFDIIFKCKISQVKIDYNVVNFPWISTCQRKKNGDCIICYPSTMNDHICKSLTKLQLSFWKTNTVIPHLHGFYRRFIMPRKVNTLLCPYYNSNTCDVQNPLFELYRSKGKVIRLQEQVVKAIQLIKEYRKKRMERESVPSYIATITTCLHLEGKMEQAKICLNSLFKYEPVLKTRLIMVNEYSAESERNIEEIRNTYPGIRIIQKEEKHRGQAYSVNMILKMLREKKPKYWIHWEESWETKGPFLKQALKIMENNNDIGQLQIARGWLGYTDIPAEHNGEVYIKQCKIDEIKNKLGPVPVKHGRWKPYPWPLYSLQPGIDRVSVTSRIGDFIPNQNRNPRGKVDGSEFNFSHRWFCKGYQKSVLYPYRVTRQANHITTKDLLRKKIKITI